MTAQSRHAALRGLLASALSFALIFDGFPAPAIAYALEGEPVEAAGGIDEPEGEGASGVDEAPGDVASDGASSGDEAPTEDFGSSSMDQADQQEASPTEEIEDESEDAAVEAAGDAATEPDAGEPNAVEAGTGKPNLDEPSAAEPDAAEPTAAEPDAVEPDTEEQGTETEAALPAEDRAGTESDLQGQPEARGQAQPERRPEAGQEEQPEGQPEIQGQPGEAQPPENDGKAIESVTIEQTSAGATAGQEAAASQEEADPGEAPDPAETFETIEVASVEETYVPEGVVDDNDELFEAYIGQRLEEALPGHDSDGQAGPIGIQGLPSIDTRFTEVERLTFANLRNAISEIAAGVRPSAAISIPISTLIGELSWSYAELGLTSGASGDNVKRAVAGKIALAMPADILGTMNRALLTDCAFELYWYNKTKGVSYVRDGYSIDYNGSKAWVTTGPAITYMFEVIDEYASPDGYYTDDNGETHNNTVNTTLITAANSAVNTAIANAQKVVTDSQGESTFARLTAYKDAICEYVDYNDSTEGVPYGNPWQLIWVFDGDASTKVVCEGYAKAFEYLCDLDPLPGVTCYTVTGQLGSGTGAGPHMWNVVNMPDGLNYLVDVTNCDSGTAGHAWTGETDLLFLKAPKSGSVSGGYTFATHSSTGSTFYGYDANTRNLLRDAELTLAANDYVDPDAAKPRLGDGRGAIRDIPNLVYTGSGIEPAITVTYDGRQLVQGTDYIVKFADNVNVGTATVTVLGIGGYVGKLTTTFDIARKQIAKPTAATGLVYSGRVQTGVPTGEGYTLSGATAKDAGSYTATATLDDNHVWTGNGTMAASIPWSIAKAKVDVPLAVANLTYNGQVQTGVAAGEGYTLSGAVSATGAGNYTATATLADANNYEWSDGTVGAKTIKWTIDKAANPIAASAKAATQTVTYSASAAAKAAANVTVAKAQGALTYANASADATAKGFGVDKSTGAVTVPEGTAAGTYAVAVEAKAAGNGNYKAGYKTVSFKLSVTKAANPIAASAKAATQTVTYSASAAAKAAANVTVAKAQGAVTYANASTDATAKKFSVNKSTGAVTVPKGAAAGTYTVAVKAIAAGDGNYKSGSKTVSFKLTVAKAASTIKLAAQTKTYTGKALAYTGTVTKTGSTGKVTYRYYSDSACTKEVKPANVKNAGTYYVKATLAADANHKAATSAAAKLTVSKAASTIKLAAQTKTYAGKALAYTGKVTKTGSTGKITYAYYKDSACKTAVKAADVKAAGTYYVRATVAASANHKAATSAAAKLTIAKAANPVTVKATARSASLSTLKSKAVAVAPLAVTKAQGKVTYAKASGSSALAVNKTTGKVTVKKGTKKGTYTATVKVTAAGNANYKSGSKTVTVKVTVK